MQVLARSMVHVKSFHAAGRTTLQTVIAAGNSALRGQARLSPKQTLNITLQQRFHTSKMGPKRKSANVTPSPASALEQLQQSQSLKLLAIAETLSPKDLPRSAKKRNSAVSEDSEQNGDTHPAALEADLLHYKVQAICTRDYKHTSNLLSRNCSVNFASATSSKSPRRSSCAA
jgi:hypothetical protein